MIWSHLRIGRALAVPLGHPAHPLLDLLETCEKPYDLRVFAAITGGKERKKTRVYRTSERCLFVCGFLGGAYGLYGSCAGVGQELFEGQLLRSFNHRMHPMLGFHSGETGDVAMWWCGGRIAIAPPPPDSRGAT